MEIYILFFVLSSLLNMKITIRIHLFPILIKINTCQFFYEQPKDFQTRNEVIDRMVFDELKFAAISLGLMVLSFKRFCIYRHMTSI